MSAQKLRTRGWTFTINNDTFEDLIGLIETDFEYLVIGFEVGDSGTPHIQGYIYFKNPRMLKGVRNLMPRAHLLVSRGTALQNLKYCSKSGDFYEFGTIPEQGQRIDIKEIKSMIDQGKSMCEIADNHFMDYVRYHKGFERYRDIKNNGKSQVTYIDKSDINFEIENCLYCSKESQLYNLDTEDSLVILDQSKFDTFQLMMLSKGKPYLLNHRKNQLCQRLYCHLD